MITHAHSAMNEFNVTRNTKPPGAYFPPKPNVIKQDQYLQLVQQKWPNGANMDVIQPISMLDLSREIHK